jgi:hypothetical protein
MEGLISVTGAGAQRHESFHFLVFGGDFVEETLHVGLALDPSPGIGEQPWVGRQNAKGGGAISGVGRGSEHKPLE